MKEIKYRRPHHVYSTYMSFEKRPHYRDIKQMKGFPSLRVRKQRDAKGCERNWEGNKNGLYLDCEDAKTLLLKWANCIVCKLYLNKSGQST